MRNRLSRRSVGSLMMQLGLLHSDSLDADIRNDAGETATFTRQLEHVITEVYRVQYPELRAQDFIPLDTSVPSGAQSFVWRIWDWRGMAKILDSYADDLPTVEIMGAERAQVIHSLGVGYSYSIQDQRAAAMAGFPLDTEKGNAAKRAHLNKIEVLAAFGDAAAGLPGMLNNPNVPLLTPPGDIAGDWMDPATSALSIKADLHTIARSIRTTTKTTETPDTLLLPPSIFDKLATTPLSSSIEKPILRAFLDADPYIRNVDQWPYLETADAAGTGPRVVAYRRDKRVISLVIPQQFEQFPPQAQNLGFKIPCHSRYGGVTIRYPLGMVYVDGVGNIP